MKVSTLSYRAGQGWSQPLPADLDSPATLVLVFGAREDDALGGAFDELRQALPNAHHLGCSTAGEMYGAEVRDASLSVAIARFEHTRLRLAQSQLGPDDDGSAVGAALAAQLSAPDLAAVFVLSDGLMVNGTALVAAMRRDLPPSVPLSGGLAGDGDRFGQTWVLAEGQRGSGRVVALGLYGSRLRAGHGCDGGWMDFGPERRITRSVGNVLYELDGKPALDLYKRYLGDLAAGLPGTALLFPLSVRPAQSDSAAVVRTVLAVSEADQSMTFAGDVPQGHIARLMRTTGDDLIGSAADAADSAVRAATPAENAASLAISVSCVGRRLVLGERTDEEVETITASLPQGAGHVGFYSYGEIAPSGQLMGSELHNQTMTVTILTEV